MVFTCKRCGYEACDRRNLMRHLQRQFPCEPIDLSHFIPRETLLSDLIETKRAYKASSPPQQTWNNCNIHNDHSTHQHIHIHVNDFGAENLKYLKIAGGDRSGAFLKALPDLASLVRAIHFHPDHPENHNVCVTNVKDDVAFVMRDAAFQPASAKSCAETLLQTARRMWEVYESWNEELEDSAEISQWRELISIMADKLNRPSERKQVREKQKEVLRVLHHESKRLWPEGSRTLHVE